MVSSPQHEPTMEEILASIRKIISEDSPEQQPVPAPVAEAKPAPQPEPESDVLDLTQEVVETPPPPPPPPPPAPEPVVQAAPPPPPPAPEHDVVFEPIEEPVHQPAATDGSIFSDKTRAHMENVFANIDTDEEETAAHTHSPVAVPVSGLPVEAVFERAVREAFAPVVKEWLGENAADVIEHMKPLVREWMDEHFPALLEGAVRDEVARVARARGSKR